MVEPAAIVRPKRLVRSDADWRSSFTAMAGPCEVLVNSGSSRTARAISDAVAAEAWRIEAKFSRYRSDNIIHRLNTARGAPVQVDDETSRLLDFAAMAYEVSDGRFDVTSGILRRAWRFDGSDRLPEAARIEALRPLVGWRRVRWRSPEFSMPTGMEVDLGGVGKEYAVDRACDLAREAHPGVPFLLNFGGDLRASGARRDGLPWSVGVDAVQGAEVAPARQLELRTGGIATSGDARRYLERDGVRYSHVLDPRTGWPVRDAPRSVTVLADSCTEAGLIATLALLHGPDAESFLRDQGALHWVQR